MRGWKTAGLSQRQGLSQQLRSRDGANLGVVWCVQDGKNAWLKTGNTGKHAWWEHGKTPGHNALQSVFPGAKVGDPLSESFSEAAVAAV